MFSFQSGLTDHEVESIADLHHDLHSNRSTVRTSFKEWKMKLLASSTTFLPSVDTITMSQSINTAYIFSYGNQLQCDGEYFEAFFVYKIAFNEYLCSSNAIGMTNCLGSMMKMVRKTRSKQMGKGKQIARRFLQEVQLAMDALDESPFPSGEKIARKAACLQQLGDLFSMLDENTTALVKFESCISMLDGLYQPEKHVVYGDAFSGKGMAYYRLREYDKALSFLNISLNSLKRAKDFSNETHKKEKISEVEYWITMTMAKLNKT